VSGSYDMGDNLAEMVGLINFRIGAWHDFGYADPPTPECKTIPPLGERSVEAIKGAQGAVQAIDELLRELHQLRQALIGELRANANALNARVDALPAESPAKREADPRPEWLYGQGCCEQWTPEDGCTLGTPHTGRPAMSLRVRELDCPGDAGGAP
jgi:hypothetical protein